VDVNGTVDEGGIAVLVALERVFFSPLRLFPAQPLMARRMKKMNRIPEIDRRYFCDIGAALNVCFLT
jgi:hypothetical protein